MASRRLPVLSSLALVACFALGARADVAPAAEPPSTVRPVANGAALTIPFEKYRLENGLTVILHQDRALPLVAVNLWYHAGPVNEPKGRSGFAHLFEHLMFEGSRHVGREFDRLLESVGATNVNGTTSWDRTNYFETVPREHLPLVLWIESDRMAYMLDGLVQERLDVQRDVVKNERRQSYENAPYGPSTLALLDTCFPAGHPYHGAIIGSMQDLSAATLDDVRDFFKSYYAPSNATLTLAGDFEVEEAKAQIAKYFATLPDRPRPAETREQSTPPLSTSAHQVVKEPVELARVAFGYVTPPAYGKEDPVLDVTMAILAGGKATRLYRALVMEGKLASEVDASLDSNRLASLAVLTATVTSGKKPEEVSRAMDAVLLGVAERGPTTGELDRAKRRILVDVFENLELLNGPGGETGRAGLLQRFDLYLGDPGYLPKWIAAIESVSAADVQRVVREQLSPTRRAVVITEPDAGASRGGRP
jgi:zinc protease